MGRPGTGFMKLLSEVETMFTYNSYFAAVFLIIRVSYMYLNNIFHAVYSKVSLIRARIFDVNNFIKFYFLNS